MKAVSKNLRNLLAWLLCVCMLAGPVVPFAAASKEAAASLPWQGALAAAIDPRFTHVSQMSSGLKISVLGRATCSGSATLRNEYDSTLTIVLQQYINDRWTDIQEWSQDFTGSGTKLLEKSHYVDSGYRYRVVTTIDIWDGDEVIESIFCDSPIKEH